MERLTDREDISSSWNRCVHRFSKPGAAHDGFSNLEGSGNKPAQPLPLKCLFTGLPASEGSGNDESEREVDIGSPSMVFASFSFSSSSSSSSSSSLPLEAKQADKATGAHRPLRDTQGGHPAKKPKRSQKSSPACTKKSWKAANSSSGEVPTTGERPRISTSFRTSVPDLKSASQTPPPASHICNTFVDSDPQQQQQPSRSPSDLENMSTTERINFLQEKLRCIHSHYLSLKSEVALIDRKRKLQKKME